VIYSAGVDSKISKIKKTGRDWVVERGRRYHTHDIAALDVAYIPSLQSDCILSGGIDTLLFSQLPVKVSSKEPIIQSFYPFVSFPSCSLSRAMILSNSESSIHLWKLGMSLSEYADLSLSENYATLPLDSQAEPILSLDLKTTRSIHF